VGISFTGRLGVKRRVVTVSLFMATLLAAFGCRRSSDAGDARRVVDAGPAKAAVEALVRCEIAGDRDCVARRLDLDAKARVLFGTLYSDADDGSRGATRTMLLDMFMAAGPSLRARYFDDGVGALSVVTAEADSAVVLEAGERLRLEYRVARGDAGWRVEDRVRLQGGHRADPRVLVEKFLKDFEGERGRAATLADVNRDLPGFLGTHRARTLRIPKKKKSGGRR